MRTSVGAVREPPLRCPFRGSEVEGSANSDQSGHFPVLTDGMRSVNHTFSWFAVPRSHRGMSDTEEGAVASVVTPSLKDRLSQLGIIAPVDPEASTRWRPASKLLNLHGKTGGFLGNRKANADLLLLSISEMLHKRFELKDSLVLDKYVYPTFPIWLNIPLSKSSAFFKPLSICETLAVGMAIITP